MVRRVSLQLSQSVSISEPGVSGTSLLNAVNLIAYNVFYTSIPISVSLVDKDLSEGTVMQHPQILYYCQAGRNHHSLTVPKIPNSSSNPILSIIMKIGFSIRVFTEEEKMTKINHHWIYIVRYKGLLPRPFLKEVVLCLLSSLFALILSSLVVIRKIDLGLISYNLLNVSGPLPWPLPCSFMDYVS
ncbi:hypothetical protein HYC85_026487 [Camellia sinensis]|uniref:P-type ATPase C-terminal domain-containing protein n=1 Tax=Camellia sinensis TaxID=4442 RepID=A0A7J7G7E8_CAMSI|nr:hypothetical protein HYC85_026487 [Camellia sinensis]